MFVHLRLKTEFSLLNSVLTIDKIVNYTKEDSALAVGMMDDFSLSGTLQFSSYISKNKVKPIIGVNVCVIDNKRMLDDVVKLPYFGFIAQTKVGYQNLLKLLYYGESLFQKSSRDELYLYIDDLTKVDLTDVICITGGYGGLLSRQFLQNRIDDANITAESLKNIFGDRLYVELTRHGNKYEEKLEDLLVDLAYKYNVPLVATNDVHFAKSTQFEAYDALTCIKHGRYITEKNREILNPNYYLKNQGEMMELFADIPEAIQNTVEIAKRCSFYLQEGKPMLPSFPTENGRSENDELRILAENGLEERLLQNAANDDITNLNEAEQKSTREQYFARLEYELSVIEKMGFAGYFLIVSDFICWAKENKIPVGPGRGSGAGSIIAWATKITDLDPIQYGLYFERFLNPDRVSMPDFDIDFCQSRRGEVIEYVQQKYGKSRVASIITFGKLQAKAVLKDVGRVMQLSYNAVDEVCKMIPFSPLDPITIAKAIQMDSQLQDQIQNDPDIQNLVRIAMELEGLNRHHSTHAAGIIIGARDLIEITPLIVEENTNLPVIAFNMKDVEKIGLLKFDFLGLKTLTVIQQVCDLVESSSGKKININNISVHNEKTFQLLQSTKLRGIFQLETGTPREALAKIKTDRIEDLIAITSLNRPGPMENIPDYIRRKLGQDKVEYPHPLLASVLEETYGVIIYQEQVMEVARVIAGYTLAEADLLRRAMGKKIKEEMDQQKAIFASGAERNGINKDKASEIFDLVEKFAGYGFNKAHAAAYSVISYQTAYLKANYQIEFFIANLNLEISDTDKLNEFINDAKGFKIPISLPDINKSFGEFQIGTFDDKLEILYALGGLKSVGLNSAMEIAKIRAEKGSFTSIFDFAKKVGHKICNKKQLESLILTGSFDKLHENRKQLFESVEIIVKYAGECEKMLNSNQNALFGGENSSEDLSAFATLKNVGADYSFDEKLAKELDCIGFYLSSHPLLGCANVVNNPDIFKSGDLADILPGVKKNIKLAGVVTKITQRFRKSGRFCFIQLTDLDGVFEVAVFNSDLISNARDLIIEGKLICLDVSASRDDSGLRLIANEIRDISSVKLSKSSNNNAALGVQNVVISANLQPAEIRRNISPKIPEITQISQENSTIKPDIIAKEINHPTPSDIRYVFFENSLELNKFIKKIKAFPAQNGTVIIAIFRGMKLNLGAFDISHLDLQKYE